MHKKYREYKFVLDIYSLVLYMSNIVLYCEDKWKILLDDYLCLL